MWLLRSMLGLKLIHVTKRGPWCVFVSLIYTPLQSLLCITLSNRVTTGPPNSTHCGLVTPYGDIDLGKLVQVMACFLTATSHCINQLCLIITSLCSIQPNAILQKMFNLSVHKTGLKTILLTQWGQVTHICVSKQTTIGPDNGLSPDRRQAIIWTSAGILLIGPLSTNLNEILIEIHTYSFKKISSGKWPQCFKIGA